MSAEPDYLPADALAEDEPKYLRRQKPVEIRKRKFSRKTWPLYRRVLVGGIATIAAGLVLYEAGNYFLFSPGVMLMSADQIHIEGNRFVPRDAIVEKFSADMGRSVVRVPLGERRPRLESLPWVEQAGFSACCRTGFASKSRNARRWRFSGWPGTFLWWTRTE